MRDREVVEEPPPLALFLLHSLVVVKRVCKVRRPFDDIERGIWESNRW